MNKAHHLTPSKDSFSLEVCIEICLFNFIIKALLPLVNCHSREFELISIVSKSSGVCRCVALYTTIAKLPPEYGVTVQ